MPTTATQTRPTRARTIAGLAAMGFIDGAPPHAKYRCFHRHSSPTHYLVGNSGAIRFTHTGGSIAASISLTGGEIHAAIATVGDPAFRYENTEQAREVFHRITGMYP